MELSSPLGETKSERYEQLLREVQVVLAGEDDPVAWMATLSCLIRERTGCSWAGFYRVLRNQLVLGPYQGSLGCLRIPFTRGVCGACATRRESIIVPDVHRFPGHIACDSRSNSEIVVPVFDLDGQLQAVLDLDSAELAAFDDVDQNYLEQLAGQMMRLAWTDPH
jgi:L-methionine (R)-S-oxide reductase